MAASVKVRVQTQIRLISDPVLLPTTKEPGLPEMPLGSGAGGVPSKRQRKPESLNNLMAIPGIIPMLQMRRGSLQKREIICPEWPKAHIAELGSKPWSLYSPSAPLVSWMI